MTTATAPAPQRIPRKDPVLMEALVMERWHMLTLDTDLNKPEWIATSDASKWTEDLETSLAYALARLCGDGFEGEVATRDVVERLQDTIGEELRKAAVAFRCGLADECVPEA